MSRMRWRWIRVEGFLWETAETIESRSSIRTENSWRNGNSSAARAVSSSIRTTPCTSQDSESSATRNQADWKRGIRIGNARDGKVTAFIPDPWNITPTPATTAEGVAADSKGNVYGSEVTEQRIQRYVRR